MITQSAIDQWLVKMESNPTVFPNELGNKKLSEVPYSLLEAFLKNIDHKMLQTWNFQTVEDLKPLVQSQDCPILVQDVINNAHKINQLPVVLQKFRNGKSQVKERIKADQDIRFGKIQNSEKEELAKLIQNSQKDWRLLAEGLGFDNLACRSMNGPKEMLDCLPDLSGSRLYFEAKRLDMTDVCAFFNKSDEKEFLNLNRYQLEHLYKLFEDYGVSFGGYSSIGEVGGWINVASKTGALGVYKFETEIPGDYISDTVEAIWICPSQLNLKEILALPPRNKEVEDVLKSFKYEIESGIFKSVSPGGVSLSQVLELGKSVSENRPKGFNLLALKGILAKEKYDSTTGRIAYPDYSKINSFTHFLLMYWQMNPKLDLKGFCSNVLQLLQNNTNEDPKVADYFREAQANLVA